LGLLKSNEITFTGAGLGRTMSTMILNPIDRSYVKLAIIKPMIIS
jgi:hypothetical protein